MSSILTADALKIFYYLVSLIDYCYAIFAVFLP